MIINSTISFYRPDMQTAEASITQRLSVQEILNDYRIAWESRHASLAGRKEVFMGKAKFGIFGDGKEVAQLAMAKFFQNGDFRSGYLVVDRTGVRVLRDPYSAKPYVLFYTTKRVGGGVQNFEAIKLVKFAAS